MAAAVVTLKAKTAPRSDDEIAAEMVDLLEGYFDEIGLPEEQREERYAKAAGRVSDSHTVLAIAAASD